MSSTTFIDNQTVIYAAWLNDVNTAVYSGTFPNGSLSLTTLSVSGSVSGAGFTTLVNNVLSAPGIIGSVTPNTGAFTTISTTGTSTLGSSTGIVQVGGGSNAKYNYLGQLSINGGSYNYIYTTANLKGLGLGGENWNNAGKAVNTTYTNSRTYPIMVMVSISQTNTGGTQVIVNAQQIASGTASSTSNTYPVFTFIVPPGQTYLINNSGGGVSYWFELY